MHDIQILFTDDARIHFDNVLYRQTPSTFEVDRDDGSTVIWPLANLFEITITLHSETSTKSDQKEVEDS